MHHRDFQMFNRTPELTGLQQLAAKGESQQRIILTCVKHGLQLADHIHIFSLISDFLVIDSKCAQFAVQVRALHTNTL
jgi:hypothetical protein